MSAARTVKAEAVEGGVSLSHYPLHRRTCHPALADCVCSLVWFVLAGLWLIDCIVFFLLGVSLRLSVECLKLVY